MAIDLKPLTSEIIHKMGYSTHDLWVVKVDEDAFGPFEIDSLKQFAIENEHEFHHALACRMDTSDWKPFYSHAQFRENSEHHAPVEEVVEKYWIINQGLKAGPLSRLDIDKKLELSIISLSDSVSIDDGQTWAKFYALASFNDHQGGTDALPMAPLESSFHKAREDLFDWMETQKPNDPASSMAALTYLGQHKDKNKVRLNLHEIDLKSVRETQVSRSLKWVVPYAVAGVSVLAMVGNFLLSPSGTPPAELSAIEEIKTERILPVGPQRVKPTQRTPASYRPPIQHQPVQQQHSHVQNARDIQQEYPSHVETHYNEPDPLIDPRDEEVNYMPRENQEPSLVTNNVPGNESLDDMMNGAAMDPGYPPEQPVIEESNDF
jgi:hypothetical protein